MAADKPLLLVDGSSYLFRAFYALPDLRTLDGFPTGAIRGVIGMLRKLANDYEGSPVAVVFDVGGKIGGLRSLWYGYLPASAAAEADSMWSEIEAGVVD